MNNLTANKAKKPLWLSLMAIFAVLFGVATIKEGGSVLFTETGRISAGDYVPFVVWFNFFAGFAYVAAGVVLFRQKSCSRRLSTVIAVSSTIVFILLGLYILNGGAYELRTVAAMALRSALWIFITVVVLRSKVLKPINCQC